MHFLDRADAGRFLARELIRLRDARDLIVLALPRGGVPVGYEIARELHAPLDVFVVRKLGVPGREELAMGALASGGVRVLNPDVVSALGWHAEEAIEHATKRESEELRRREERYRGNRPFPNLLPAKWWCWWTTDWRRAQQCERPRARCGNVSLRD